MEHIQDERARLKDHKPHLERRGEPGGKTGTTTDHGTGEGDDVGPGEAGSAEGNEDGKPDEWAAQRGAPGASATPIGGCSFVAAGPV